jgi:hypothetical protein
MLSGILIIIKKTVVDLLLPLNPLTNAVGTFGLLVGMFALTGIYFYLREESGRLGLIGYLVIWFGLGVASGPDYARNYILPYMSKSEIQALLAGPTKLVFVSSALFFLTGVILFSAALFRTRKFSPLAVSLFLVGFTLFSVSFLLPDVVSRTGEILGALGVIWLGYAMWTALRKITTIQPGQVVRV